MDTSAPNHGITVYPLGRHGEKRGFIAKVFMTTTVMNTHEPGDPSGNAYEGVFRVCLDVHQQYPPCTAHIHRDIP